MPKTIEELQAELEAMRQKMNAVEEEETGEEGQDDDPKDDEPNSNEGVDDNQEPADEGKGEEEGNDEDKLKIAALKKSLNALDTKYKEALREKAAAEKAKREAEIEALKNEGKELEALQKEKEDLEAELAVLRDENVGLKRDSAVDSALNSMEFKSDRSRKIARQDIVANLVRDDNGNWASKDGKAIDVFTAAYFEDKENRAMFLKAKTNSGAGTNTNPATPAPQQPKSNSLFDMPQEELMKQVRKKLGR